MAEMGTLEYDYQDFHRPRAGDDKLAIRFFRKARQDPDKSVEEGRPIFVEQDYIEIVVPGDRSSIIVRPVKAGDAQRFAQQYAHWKATQTNMEAEGTPLEAWGKLNLAQIEEYRYYGVRTVEHLADLRDDVVIKIPGTHELKRRAQEFISMAKDSAPLQKMMAELETRDNKIETLEKAIQEQAELIKQLKNKGK